MAEILQKDGTWVFDGDTVRIVPGCGRSVGPLRRALGEVAVPLRALAGIAVEPGRRAARLRLRLRDGADPLLGVAGGLLDDASDPYRLTVANDRAGVAEYLVDEVRAALLLDGAGSGPADAFLLPGPALPIAVAAGDGTVGFDGERVRLEWNWRTGVAKSAGGARVLALAEVVSVEWLPASGLDTGRLRFRTAGDAPGTPPRDDPHAVELRGSRRDPLTALVGAAVVARLPHPRAGCSSAAAPPAPREAAPAAGDHDALLRRLAELGALRRQGVLTAEEFTTAKQAVLRRL